jgi:hypothetical protein
MQPLGVMLAACLPRCHPRRAAVLHLRAVAPSALPLR